MRQRRQRHERPGFINDGAVLAAVNTTSRRVPRWPAASVDRHCARRLPELRPGRRNAVQPNRETSRSPLRRERRSTRRFSGRINTSLPEAASLPGRWIGSGRKPCRRRLGEARQPRASKIGPALSFSNTIRRQPSADPVQKHDPGSGNGAKKGLTSRGPLQKQGFVVSKINSHLATVN